MKGEQVLVILEEDALGETILSLTTFIDGVRCTASPFATVIGAENIKIEAIKFFNNLTQQAVEKIRCQMEIEAAKLTKEGKLNGIYAWN